MIKIRNLSKYFGGLAATKNMNLEVRKGEILGLIGPNGAGKTTLFNLITGFCTPDSGTIKLKGENIVGFKPNEITKRGIARTFQIVRPFINMTVMENVLVGEISKIDHNIFKVLRKCSPDQKKKGSQILDLVGLKMEKNDFTASLPYALKKKVEISRALATEPELLLLDEPTAGLNPKELNDQITLIKKLNSQGITIVIIEHRMRMIMSISDRIIVLSYGEKIAEGTPREISQNKAVIDAYLGRGLIA